MNKKEVSTYYIDKRLKLKFKIFSARKKTSASKMLEVAMLNLLEPGHLGNRVSPGR